VASDSAGHFIIAWTSFGQDGYAWGIYAQRYSLILPVALQGFRVE
jgi:hypothetical protein